MLTLEQSAVIRQFTYNIVETIYEHNSAINNNWYEPAKDAVEKLKKLRTDMDTFLLSITESIH